MAAFPQNKLVAEVQTISGGPDIELPELIGARPCVVELPLESGEGGSSEAVLPQDALVGEVQRIGLIGRYNVELPELIGARPCDEELPVENGDCGAHRAELR